MVLEVAAIVVTVVGWFLASNINKLNKLARKSATDWYKSHTGLKEKLEELENELSDVSDIVKQARFISNQDGIDRLWRLKDAIHDAEEVLDSFEYDYLEADLKKKRHHTSGGGAMMEIAKQYVTKDPLMSELKKVVRNLRKARLTTRELITDSKLLAGSGAGASSISCRGKDDTAPLPVKHTSLFFGYETEYAQLVSKLRDRKDDLAVIAVLGHGGMGKTELARQAFRDVAAEFAIPIWIHACNKFNKTELLREICGSIHGASPADLRDMNAHGIQRELKNLMASQRCLLVLDDVCHDESATDELERRQAWDDVLEPFGSSAGKGSRIVVTTRAKICSTTLKVASDASIVLAGIDDKSMTLLLKETAFGDRYTDRVGPELKQVFENNVGRLHGSPLAATAVALELKNCNKTHKWEERLKSDHHHDGAVHRRHLSSYHALPPHLQRCFAFCSIFPNKWRFELEKLTKMWIAHGFVEDTNMEDAARGYFQDLVDRSLFQEKLEEEEAACGGDKETNCYYVIHEQIHSMIRHVSAKYCMTISGAEMTRVPRTVHHLSVTHRCLGQLKPEHGLKKLRTLLVLKDDDDLLSSSPPSNAVDNGVLKNFKGVRVLDLTETGMPELPESIGELKHVRYLGLPYTMKKTPDELTRLLFLQTFCVSKTCQLDILPKKKKKKCVLQISPKDVSRLTNMRHLDVDIDCSAAGQGKERHSISGLAAMNSLAGTLSIKGLETVAGKEEAQEAGLANKESVKVLKLEWSSPNTKQVEPSAGSSAAAADVVLEGLQPNPNLLELSISRYPGTTSPTWLADSSALVKLTSLYLWNCRKLQALPAVGGLPCLELLYIKELPSVKRIDGGFCNNGGTFPKLKKIVLKDMPQLVAWDDMPLPIVFPELSEVCIADCPLLSSLSGLGGCRGSLSWLRVERCQAVTEASMPADFTRSGFPYLVECTPPQLQALLDL